MKRTSFLALMVLLACATQVFAQSNAEKEGAEVYAKYQTAIGGKENLDKIKNIEKEIESTDARGKSVVKSIEEKATGKNYYHITTPQGLVIETGFDGERSWQRSDQYQGYIEITPPSPVVRYSKLPNEEIDGKEYIVLKEYRKDGLSNSKSYYDPETFLLIHRIRTLSINGQTIENKITYSDYRSVGDVREPFAEISVNSRVGKTTRSIISIKHNVEIKPSLFEY